jgi:3-keto-disaccharide hydrolase
MRVMALALLLPATAAAAGAWHSLFDGKTTYGWVEVTGKPFPANCWRVEDGCLKALVRKDGFQDIRTRQCPDLVPFSDIAARNR